MLGTHLRSEPMEQCIFCGDYLAQARHNLGYRTCLECGEEQARQDRKLWCVVPMHKSNYFYCTDPLDLQGINNKGGLVR